MSSHSNKKKRSKGLDVIRPCNDRITNLPGNLISKILSCLPTKDAVATSILSTQWKTSWTSLTNLDFEFYRGFHCFDCNSPFFRKVRGFVNRVLLLRDKSCLQKFHLRGYRDYDDSLVNAWLIVAVQCHVQELDITIKLKHQGLLASDIFRCSTLVVLKLSADQSYVIKPTTACLPCLRTLHIDGAVFSNDESITSLLSGCCVLEELRLRNCVGKDVRVVKIIAHALKKLVIERLSSYCCVDNEAHLRSLVIMIDTPALECFNFVDRCFCTQVKIVSNMNHLINANITIGNSFIDQLQEVHSEGVKDFLNGISQVKTLVFSWDSIEVIRECNPVLPKFINLNYLELHTYGDPELILFVNLLENSPSLETLYLIQDDSDKLSLDNSPFHDVPYCFLINLKKVEIENFYYSEGEMAVVEYILKNAKILEKLILHCDFSFHDSMEDAVEFLKELVTLPRASASCKVIVV